MIGIISSSSNNVGFSVRLSEIYLHEIQSRGEDAQIFLLADIPRDVAFENLFGPRSEAWKPTQEKVNFFQRFIFVVPEYNGSYPGILKTFIDACEFPHSFSGKKAALAGFSGGMFGNLRGLDHLDSVLGYLNVALLPYRVHIPRIQDHFDENGNFLADTTMEQIKKQVEKFLAF